MSTGYRMLLYSNHELKAETVLKTSRPLFYPTLLKAIKELGQMHPWCDVILSISLFDAREPIEHVRIK